MKYTLIKRNKSFRADSHSHFVSWMRKMDLQYWKDNKDFMEGYSYRKLTFEKIEIRHEEETLFVEDLQKNNLLKIDSFKRFVEFILSLKINISMDIFEGRSH